jgi:tetratricopeptide (TPR) repeat protein
MVIERIGRYAEALAACDEGLARLDAAPEGPERDSVRAALELNAGAIHYRQTNNDEAIRWLEAAAAHADRAGHRSTLARAYYLLDAAHSDFGSADGIRYLELARPIYEELGDLRGLGVVLSNLGIHAYYEGRWTEAVAFYRESHDVQERGGYVGAMIQVNNEAEVLSDQGHLDEAIRLFQDFLRVARASGWAFGVAGAQSNLGRAAARSGRFEEAHEYFDAALKTFEELSAERFKVEAMARRAECLVFEGRYREALEVANDCREAAANSPVPSGAAAGGGEAAFRRESPHRARVEGAVRGRAHAPRDGRDALPDERRPLGRGRRDSRAARRGLAAERPAALMR